MSNTPGKTIRVGQPSLHGNELKYVTDAIESTQLSMGKWVERFEREFAEWLGVKYALACSSGTAALHLALSALGIGGGDEVIVPALTYVATANAVSYTGAKPVFVDVDEQVWCIDKRLVNKSVTRRTQAVIPVHLYGVPAPEVLCGRYPTVEDAAEALGAWSETDDLVRKNERVGTIGAFGCFSLYGNKTITTGEGGMLVTNNENLKERAYLLRGQGQGRTRYYHEVVGFNYRMTEMQAAIGCAQLEQFDIIEAKRKRHFEHYISRLQGKVGLQGQRKYDKRSHWAMPIVLASETCRHIVATGLGLANIETRPIFVPLPDLPPYRQVEDEDKYPVARDIAARGLLLPLHAELTEEEVDFVCDKVIESL